MRFSDFVPTQLKCWPHFMTRPRVNPRGDPVGRDSCFRNGKFREREPFKGLPNSIKRILNNVECIHANALHFST